MRDHVQSRGAIKVQPQKLSRPCAPTPSYLPPNKIWQLWLQPATSLFPKFVRYGWLSAPRDLKSLPMPLPQIDLFLRCRGLRNKDTTSLSDPFVVVYLDDAEIGAWAGPARQ